MVVEESREEKNEEDSQDNNEERDKIDEDQAYQVSAKFMNILKILH